MPKRLVVYTITERGEKSFWTRVGNAYVNRDGSINVRLDALPVNGMLQIREWVPRDGRSTQEGNDTDGSNNPPF